MDGLFYRIDAALSLAPLFLLSLTFHFPAAKRASPALGLGLAKDPSKITARSPVHPLKFPDCC
ncbi:hypothetical protein TRIATDRAFT_302263 [Trichoderma atroviride IMI 206040]|uniref:Uncharacterized protein n=1 Tax=Hypocrea atroviridis (strain ATCC 20476 / IMI 206040) TaxID=452589 RepID=G9P472_HYPAI|nr:uncharacterized protein TRIATDRAFT_302263 [Trichoderma atroviride IMI 206040]EHK41916.1 hypothetical protein TRIATDRAFT_302263 [Trichoderma atroviride IMI 206040]